MKVAILYDRINKWGGAERVLLALSQLFPQATIFTSVYSKESTPWADKLKIKTTFLQSFPLAKKTHELYALLMPLAFESLDLSGFDLVISITSEAAKGVITGPQTLHICYCLTPTRYLWSGYEEYFSTPLFKIVSYPAVAYLKWWEKAVVNRPDYILAISTEVKSRIKSFYNKNSEIIFPPVEIFPFKKIKNTNGEYFLVVSRLVSYKKVDLAIKACNLLKKKLIIVGTGNQRAHLQSLAGDTIEFVGKVTDSELGNLYTNAKAVIFPGFEDFGIVMGEAIGFGTPVIAYAKGGALDIVKKGQTGILFKEQTIDSLLKAIKSFEKTKFNTATLKKDAKRFSKEEFQHNISAYIDKALQMKEIRL